MTTMRVQQYLPVPDQANTAEWVEAPGPIDSRADSFVRALLALLLEHDVRSLYVDISDKLEIDVGGLRVSNLTWYDEDQELSFVLNNIAHRIELLTNG